MMCLIGNFFNLIMFPGDLHDGPLFRYVRFCQICVQDDLYKRERERASELISVYI